VTPDAFETIPDLANGTARLLQLRVVLPIPRRGGFYTRPQHPLKSGGLQDENKYSRFSILCNVLIDAMQFEMKPFE
jgi:hypothetical protein